jgi:ribulose 1,5-bisphosphate synthetase/thiazole synthase
MNLSIFRKVTSLLLVTCFFAFLSCKNQPTEKYDVVVYGGTSAGVIAAYTAKVQGKSVLLIEPTNHLGGLTTGGLGQTDIGNKYAITGLSRDFYRRVGTHYGKLEQWTFEPHVAKGIFLEYLEKAGVEVVYNKQLTAVDKEGTIIRQITVKDATLENATLENAESGVEETIFAKVFIDATYEGDLLAKAGVSYTVGREANSQYGENWNGVQLMDKHQFPEGVDPYVEKGNPASGLLWGVSDESLAPTGSGDKKVQAYNFRLCLTDSVENQVPITRPVGYDSTNFELLLRYIEVKKPHELNWALMHIQPMPGRKTDINNSGPFSTDFIGENYDYPDATYEEREKIIEEHKLYTQSLLYFLGNDIRVPEHLRNEMQKWGYPKDEYMDSDNFSPQLYVREARRMVGEYVMSEKHCIGEEKVGDGIGMAAYTMDSHNTQRLVVDGMAKNEGDVQQGTPNPFPISYRSIIPKKEECTNLLVPVCLSASHIAFGSIRMEPVFMVLGQSAGLAAAMAVAAMDIDANVSVQDVDVVALQKKLRENPLSNGSTSEILIDNEDKTQVKVTGEWEADATAGNRYGKNYLINASSEAEGQSVTFQPNFNVSGEYKIYVYVPEHPELAETYSLKVKHSTATEEVYLTTTAGKNDWLYAGTFPFERDKGNNLLIEKIDSKGVIIADAVLFLPVGK